MSPLFVAGAMFYFRDCIPTIVVSESNVFVLFFNCTEKLTVNRHCQWTIPMRNELNYVAVDCSTTRC